MIIEKASVSIYLKYIRVLAGLLDTEKPNIVAQLLIQLEAVYSSSPYEYIYFTLNDYNMSQSQNIFGMFSKSILGDNILAIIPVTSNSFNICFDNGVNLLEKKENIMAL